MEWFAHYGHVVADDGSKYSWFITLVTYDPLENLYLPDDILDKGYSQHFFPHKIFTLVDEQNQRIYTSADHRKLKKFAKGKADVESATGDIFKLKSDSTPFQYKLSAQSEDVNSPGVLYGIDVDLKMTKPPLVLDGDGYVRQPYGISGYYSMTRVETGGKIMIDGVEKRVKGITWIDRQWLGASFSANVISFCLYEWFGIQLSNNEEAILYKLWSTRTNKVITQTLQINRADGTREKITDYTMDNLGYWTSPESGKQYSSGWHLKVPTKGWDLIINPVFPEQEASKPFPFWEGTSNTVEGTVNGQRVTGVATAELLYNYNRSSRDIDSKPFMHLRALPIGLNKKLLPN
jgi:predicted secreted hydrolase